ncbi:MAG TPA: HEAT repeat domain-containing protein, partial [Planctomycetota bacterium]|nr:HEAT repeat domain-containing protein [Planctomycetota bacterium]
PLKSLSALQRSSDLFDQDDDPAVREAAFRLLQALGQDAESALIGALSSPNAEFRRGAIQTLGENKSQKCLPRIAELYDGEAEKSVKEAAWKCLTGAGKIAEAYLRKYLRDQDPVVRRDALQSLMGSTSDETVAAVIALFAQETEEAPLDQASKFLATLDAKAEPAFLEGLASPLPSTRQKSINGLRDIKSSKGLGPVTDIFLGDSTEDLRSTAAGYLKSLGAAAEPALLKGLESKDTLVRLAAIQALGENESAGALEPIGRLFREDKNDKIHKKCFEFLHRMGLKAENDLLGALSDEDKDLRCEAVIALGEAKSERAIPRLLEFMTELDPRMREASEEALALIGPKAIEEVRKAVASGKVRKSAAEAIEINYNRNEVERLLEAQLGDNDSTGFYDGQFKDLEALGRDRVIPVLLKILSEANFPFRHVQLHKRVDTFRRSMKELTVMALGEIGGEGVLPALRAFMIDEDQKTLLSEIRGTVLVALHRQGDRKPLEDNLRETRAEADQMLRAEAAELKSRGCGELFSLALLYHRLRRYDEEIQTYEELLASIDRFKLERARAEFYGTTCYNLACVNSIRGNKSKSVDLLGKAVRAGFNDRGWIRKDRDLDAIRDEDGYKKLLSDDRLFEEKPLEPLPSDR